MSKFDAREFGRRVGERTKQLIEQALAPVSVRLESLTEMQADAAALRAGLEDANKSVASAEDRIKQALIDAQSAINALEVIRVEKAQATEEVQSLSARLDECIKRMDTLPTRAGEDGRDGKDGADGKDGEPGKDSEPVDDDQLDAAAQRAMNKWSVEFERHAAEVLRKAIDDIPAPRDGKDGRDGLGIDAMHVEYDGERRIGFVFEKDGARYESSEIVLPITIHRGVFAADAVYERGDQVTFGGSQWTAIKDGASGRPGDAGSAQSGWQLSAKRGRDGKDGRDGIDTTAAVKVRT